MALGRAWLCIGLAALALHSASCDDTSPSECTLGSPGCECRPDGQCEDGLSCIGAICRSQTCTDGSEGCPCGRGGACESGLTCNARNYCESPNGREGGPCYANRTCDPGLICDGATTCVRCDRGTTGCSCLSNGTCYAGLTCEMGLCSEPGGSSTIPANPSCYTPCRTGFVDASGAYRSCSVEGLMEGCLDGKQCMNGQCVVAGTNPTTCTQDTDCADFQTCIAGSCYSNCDSDAECGGARRCYRHACRLPCDSATNVCDAGLHCDLVDGTHGFCLPLGSADPMLKHTEVEGSYDISADQLSFTNVAPASSFTITNNSARPLDFVVRKISHTTFNDAGSVTETTTPMPWLTVGPSGTPAGATSITIRVPGNGGQVEVPITNAATGVPNVWEGVVQVHSDDLGDRRVALSYASTPDGRWSGKVYYFGQFAAPASLDAWKANRDSAALLAGVGNAFVQQWGALRQGRMSYEEFKAVVTSTVSESWRLPAVRAACPAGADACYPFDDQDGIEIYTNSMDSQPVPTGVVELPFAIDVRRVDPTHYSGRIVSERSLQYAGDPTVSLSFGTDPLQCSRMVGGICLGFLDTFAANIAVGGRYRTTRSDASCSRAPTGDFALSKTPWLVPGFLAATDTDPTDGQRKFWECRDRRQPFAATTSSAAAQNLAFAAANPIPDGRSRVRTIDIVDGMVVNQGSMIVLFRERYAGDFLGATQMPFDAYGLMMLERSTARLDATSFQGNSQTESRTFSNVPKLSDAAACSADVLHEMGFVDNSTASLTDPQINDLMNRLVLGAPTTGTLPSPYSASQVHYLCVDTGLFDAGPDPDYNPAACPAGSEVVYFAFTGAWASRLLKSEACQTNGSCAQTLSAWSANPSIPIQTNPTWQCQAANQVYCDTNRYDLRSGKWFYPLPTAGQVAMVARPLEADIAQAFRYRIQFQSRDGRAVGFTPAMCDASSNSIPYCYDPTIIERVRRRVDCIADLFTNRYASLDATRRSMGVTYLRHDFAVDDSVPGTRRDGFERLYAELDIMLGDDAYTRAFQTRFDLASQSRAAFLGSQFEPAGVDLSGVAGYEMYSLYQASQYYGLVLDRFYSAVPYMWSSLTAASPAQSFVTQETVTTYLDRVLRASTQRARTASEIAKRYHSIDRGDLARSVVARAYASAYLESVVIGRLMAKIVEVASPESRDQMREQMRLAGVVYRASLLEMSDVYATLTDEVTYFGLPPDYIPMPALSGGATNAFEASLVRAQQSMQLALTREEAALASSRSFDTDQAAFQAELVRLRNTYEDQLAAICGTMQGTDGNVYPAITKYAPLNARARLLGDPCGLMGNGQIHDAVAALEIRGLDFQSVQSKFDSLQQEIEIERERINTQCRLALELADFRYQTAGQVNSLQGLIRSTQLTMGIVTRRLQSISQVANLSACTVGFSTDCPTKLASLAMFVTASMASEAITDVSEAKVVEYQSQVDVIQREGIVVEGQTQCEQLRADGLARVQTMTLGFAQLQLEALKADYAIRLASSDIVRLRNQAQRIETQQEEQEQLTIDLEAARNDPNVRIYRNDAVLNADEAFYRALQDAYRATRVFEYYTSQSYPHRIDLQLVRLVGRGDYNLQNYLADLQDAYYAFQETYSTPDLRVDVLSLRDDILAIPRYADDGHALSVDERLRQFRLALADSRWLDSRGYLSVPFATAVDRLSPLTRNHKISRIEAEIVGRDVGDAVGRIYITQAGTGTVHALDDSMAYFRFPEVTAVVNPFFNGVRTFDPGVYRNERLRDRPYANTNWLFVFNQHDERANMDVNLGSLCDVVLYVYYSDFTAL